MKNKLSFISTLPDGGTFISLITDDISSEFSNLRRITAGNYVIIYEYRKEIDIITVGHIFHQAQDYGKIFRDG